jgi:hypothetical protein
VASIPVTCAKLSAMRGRAETTKAPQVNLGRRLLKLRELLALTPERFPQQETE